METSKKWYQSWTIWANLAIVIIEGLNQINQFIALPPGFMVTLATGLNVLLRFKTNKPIL